MRIFRVPGRSAAAGGFSLLELLVVLGLIGSMGMAGAAMLRPNRPGAVRQVLQQVAMAVEDAQFRADAGQRDLYLAAEGAWMDTQRPLRLTAQAFDPRGDAHMEGGRAPLLESRARAGEKLHLLAGVPMEGEAASVFRHFLASPAPEDARAAVQAACEAPFCGEGLQVRLIRARTRQLTGALAIPVAPYREGRPQVGGPMGLLVVPEGTGRVLRFYHSGEAGKGWQLL